MVMREAPSAPKGWEAAGDQLIRLEDPAGGAIAWIAPRLGANCIGYAVRRPDGWAHVLYSEGPEALAALPSRFGCPILFPTPGHTWEARYTWNGVTRTLPLNSPNNPHFMHGFAHTRPWTVQKTGPTSAEARISTASALTSEERAGYPFDVRLSVRWSLDATGLSIELEVANEGNETAPVGFGLHPYLDLDVLGGDRSKVRARLPGRSERVLTPRPTGERRPVTSPTVTLPPVGQQFLVSRTDLGDRPVAYVEGPNGGPRIAVTFVEGFQDLLLFTPDEQETVSIEPLATPPSATSQPQGHPDGPIPLAPGAARRAVARIALEEG
jgi:galactose mutarotase-like enzyme